MKKNKTNKVDIRGLFLDMQESMIQELKTIRKNVKHELTKGSGSENVWIKFLKDYLPKRYCIASAIVIDHLGNTSDALDVVIYDSQYTPFVFNKDNIKYIPAESVYAVFEAKQDVDKSKLIYAGQKIASVRTLNRTTTTFIDRGNEKPAAPLFRIIGGFLCLDKCWKDSISESKTFKNQIVNSDENHFIDIGCIMNDKSFKADIDSTDELNPKVNINFSTTEESLIFFFLKLVADLQRLGTVRPIDLNNYIDQLDSQ